jgi:hypothetical protein
MRHALAALVLASLAAAQDPPKKPQDDRKISPEEMNRRKEESFKDAEEAYKKFRSWTGRVKMTESSPSMDATLYGEGNVWVKTVDQDNNRNFYWEWKQAMDPALQQVLEESRCLFVGTSLQQTWDKARILEKYEYGTWDILLPQLLVRDGYRKKLEEYFEVQIMANPKYHKSKPDAVDWGHLGFKTQEEFDAWWKARKAQGSGGSETGFSEDRPFKDKEDKFDKENPRNKMPGMEGGEAELFYSVYLHPKSPKIKRDVRKVSLMLRPADFLPVMIIFEMANDVHLTLQFDLIRKDPTPEIKDDRFRLEASGFSVKEPQKE